MSNFLLYVLITMIVFFFSLSGIEYANSKPKRFRFFLIAIIMLTFSIWNAWALTVNENKIPIKNVEKLWYEYAAHCKEEHISWNELTFPKWLEIEASTD